MNSNECGVVFLAGGQSSRMGVCKAELEFGGRPLLAHLVERMLARFPRAVVVAAPGQTLPPTAARRVDDDRPGEGPLAGMEVGLREICLPLACVVSCDLPFLNPAVAQHLLTLCDGYDAVVPEWEGRLQPLQAIYRTGIGPVLTGQLEAGRRRVTELLSQVRTRIVSAEELRPIDPDGWSFLNMNVPRDYQYALDRWAAWETRSGCGAQIG